VLNFIVCVGVVLVPSVRHIGMFSPPPAPSEA
jgi:hypothetical protein